ncbi:MAG: extracellular solute-binding protein [Chloroflexi bacterium]|nr:extracellular solute-binding protein [Chloroflexota bacterium]
MGFDQRMSLRNTPAVFASIVMMVFSTVSCQPAAPPPEPVVLQFAYPNIDNEFYTRLADVFHDEYPYVTIELTPQSWDMLGGINPQDADVFVTSQFALGDLLKRNWVLDLTPFIEEDTQFDRDDFHPGVLDMYARDGKMWAIPSGLDLMVMYYNQDLFDSFEVAYPEIDWTWEDFLDRALQLTDLDAGVFGYGPDYDVFDPMLFIYQGGGKIFDDLQNPTRTTFDEPENIEALNWYMNLIRGYNVAPTPQQARELFGSGARTNVESGVILGKIAMWMGMLSERGGTPATPEWTMRWGAVNLPQDEESVTLAVVEGYFISEQAENPEVCWEWVSFLSRKISQRQIPARRSLLESSEYHQLVGGDIVDVAAASLEDARFLSPRLAEFEQIFPIFGRAFEAILAERATVEEALVQAQQMSPYR